MMLYGSETWKMMKVLTNKIRVFINRCLRSILRVKWSDKISNQCIWKRSKQEDIETQIKRRKWRWVGHTMRKEPNNTTRVALQWNPQGHRRRGRPTTTWRRSSSSELQKEGLNWKSVVEKAQHRVWWKSVVEALCSTQS